LHCGDCSFESWAGHRIPHGFRGFPVSLPVDTGLLPTLRPRLLPCMSFPMNCLPIVEEQPGAYCEGHNTRIILMCPMLSRFIPSDTECIILFNL
jgi:hypothetical protein